MTAQKVLLSTDHRDIVLELREDMPVTAGNFAKLVADGFYDGVIFHRIIDGFMIQGGDPTGTGRGGPGYKIPDEFMPDQIPAAVSFSSTLRTTTTSTKPTLLFEKWLRVWMSLKNSARSRPTTRTNP